MPQNMSISINGEFQVPPGFRFQPTEEELLQYYLRKKVSYDKIDFDVIREVDLNKLEPWDIQEKCKIGSTTQNDLYFFSHKDKKYPTGTRTNRATAAGFWKATGRDKVIYSYSRRIGMRKTLVFYQGRAPHGHKSDWIMHEYRLDDHTSFDHSNDVTNAMAESTQEEGWVVCRIFKKKNHHKTLDSSPVATSSALSKAVETRNQRLSSGVDHEGTLEQIFEYMGRSTTNCKEENETNSTATNNGLHDKFMKLPSTLPCPNSISSQTYEPAHPHMFTEDDNSVANNYLAVNVTPNEVSNLESGLKDWAAIDRLVASHLNGQSEISKQPIITCSLHEYPTMAFCMPADNELQVAELRSSAVTYNRHYNATTQDYNNSDLDLWSFTQSS